jgi:hypothetical protein
LWVRVRIKQSARDLLLVSLIIVPQGVVRLFFQKRKVKKEGNRPRTTKKGPAGLSVERKQACAGGTVPLVKDAKHERWRARGPVRAHGAEKPQANSTTGRHEYNTDRPKTSQRSHSNIRKRNTDSMVKCKSVWTKCKTRPTEDKIRPRRGACCRHAAGCVTVAPRAPAGIERTTPRRYRMVCPSRCCPYPPSYDTHALLLPPQIRGTSCFLGGIFLVLIGWPVFGASAF